MPAVVWALTAGSLGDIQGVITLVCKLGKAICDAGDASSDYKGLKAEMVTFIKILFQVENVVKEAQIVQASSSLQSSVHSLLSEIANCRMDLDDFLTKYPIHNRWNKIKWAFWGNSAATSLRETLRTHRQTIHMQLTMTNFFYSQCQGDDRGKTIKDIHSIIQPIKDIHSIVQQGVETMCLVDVYGNRNEIRLEHCPTFERFTDFIKYYFKHEQPPGHVYVERDAYQLLREDGTPVTDRSNWSISRGAVIEMSAIVQWHAPITQGNARCPGCSSRKKSRAKGGWYECHQCHVLFQIKEREADDSEIITPGCQIGPIKEEPEKPLEELGNAARKEIGQFRRVLILPEGEDHREYELELLREYEWEVSWFPMRRPASN